MATLSQLGATAWSNPPTLIEWDLDIPELSVLLEEADKAHNIIMQEAQDGQILTPPDSGNKLHQLQQDFAAALHYQPSTVTAEIADGQFPAEQLIQIYRNNFIISLSEILEVVYPCVKAVVGEECFSQLARQHVLTHPLQQGDVSHYGQGLCDTINNQPELVAAVPYLVDLASLEWYLDRAAHVPAIDCQFPFYKLQQLTEASLPPAPA